MQRVRLALLQQGGGTQLLPVQALNLSTTLASETPPCMQS